VFMNLECEVSTEDVMKKMLECHSLHYVLYLAMKTYGYESAEYLADQMTILVEQCDE